MHALGIGRFKGLGGLAIPALAVLLIAAVFGAAGLRWHRHLGTQNPAPAPVYVSNVSSMLGTADGTLLEGRIGQSAAPVMPQGQQTAGWLLIGLSVLGLSAIALSGAALYTKLCRRLM